MFFIDCKIVLDIQTYIYSFVIIDDSSTTLLRDTFQRVQFYALLMRMNANYMPSHLYNSGV